MDFFEHKVQFHGFFCLFFFFNIEFRRNYYSFWFAWFKLFLQIFACGPLDSQEAKNNVLFDFQKHLKTDALERPCLEAEEAQRRGHSQCPSQPALLCPAAEVHLLETKMLSIPYLE